MRPSVSRTIKCASHSTRIIYAIPFPIATIILSIYR
ncbi:hypothetical protein BURPS1710b_3009 [Burkholderia pseudomallei 1710b]|uniref:Uncharacterized protein n=1 Tax=Burkholderia pseudomallei (strain 1710b) TaxID=320372 RepID=Q3JPW6_BURP1|nr:hypothetical protein BURPS1710b_3009 [Burkholderia pseudomallei 1710b]